MPAPNDVKDFWRHVTKGDGCWEWDGYRGPTQRYGRFSLKGRKYKAHRFAWQIFYGAVPRGLHVLHKCDNGFCVRPEHLFSGTHRDNMHDMFRKGRRTIVRGSRQGQSKITESDVLKIRRLYAAGFRQVALADRFGIDQTGISKIVLHKSWQHVKEF